MVPCAAAKAVQGVNRLASADERPGVTHEHPHVDRVNRPLLFAVLGAVGIAFSAIFVRLSGVSPSTAAVFRCAYALPALGALAAWERARYSARPLAARWPAWAAGVFFAIDLNFWHHAIEEVGAGLATVLANTQVVVVGLVAWLVLGERPHRRTVVAVPVVLSGVVLISGVVGSGAYGQNPPLGVFYATITAFAYAGFLLLLRRSNADLRRPAGPLFDATLVAAVVGAAAGGVLGDLDPAPAWPAHGWLLVLALGPQVVAWLAISVSLPRLPAILTSIVLLLQPVGSVLLGMMLLAEAPSGVQLAGVVIVIVGVLLASLGARRPPPSPVDAAPVDDGYAVSGGSAGGR